MQNNLKKNLIIIILMLKSFKNLLHRPKTLILINQNNYLTKILLFNSKIAIINSNYLQK